MLNMERLVPHPRGRPLAAGREGASRPEPGLASFVAVLAGGWAVLALAAWRAHGKAGGSLTVELAAAAWLWWTMDGLRRGALATLARNWRLVLGHAVGIDRARGQAPSQGRMRHQQAEDRNEDEAIPSGILAHDGEHGAAGGGIDQSGGAAVGGELEPAVDRGAHGARQEHRSEADRQERDETQEERRQPKHLVALQMGGLVGEERAADLGRLAGPRSADHHDGQESPAEGNGPQSRMRRSPAHQTEPSGPGWIDGRRRAARV